MKIEWAGFAVTHGGPVHDGTILYAWDRWGDGTCLDRVCRRRPPKPEPRHVVFYSPRRRDSNCLRRDGGHKVPYSYSEAAEAIERLEGRARRGRMEIYRGDCGAWHVGNVTTRIPHAHRVVDRDTNALLELGERATAHLLSRRPILDQLAA